MPDTNQEPPRLHLALDRASLRFVSNSYAKAIFIANNPLISPEIASALDISEDDIVVQFNKAMFFDLFSSLLCHKTLVFNENSDGSYWGFTKSGIPERDYLAQAAREISIYFTRSMREAAKAYLITLTGDAYGGIIEKSWEAPLYAYPKDAVSSVGFKTLQFFRLLNNLRILSQKKPIRLVLVGFAGMPYQKAAWGYHDFEYEQKVYDTWLDLIRLDHMGQPIRGTGNASA